MKRIFLLSIFFVALNGWAAGPTFISSGTGAAGTGNLSVPYPASPLVNDRIILQLAIRNTPDTPTTPTGFSVLFSDANPVSSKQYLYCHDSDGTESGNLAVTITGATDVHLGRMYLFRGAAACASLYEAAGLSTNSSNTVNAVTVTTTGTYRLGVAFVAMGGGNPLPNPGSFVNEAGGNWVSQGTFSSALVNHEAINFQIASLAAIGTISGGTALTGSGGVTENINRSFALLPDPVPPENTGLVIFPIQLLPFTHQQIFTSSGTWSRPLNVDLVYVRVQAPGGGGGGGQGASGVGDDPGGGAAAGGAGQLVQDWIAISGDVTVTVGAGGAGGAGGAAAAIGFGGDPGGNGTNSSFGSLIAIGGNGGEGGGLVIDAAGGPVVPTPTPGSTGTASDALPVQFFAMRGERGFQGGRGARIGTSQQTVGASSTLILGGAVGVAGAAPALGTGAGGGASTEYGIGGHGGNGGNNTDFPGFPGQDGQGAGTGGGGGGGGATFSVGGFAGDGGDGGDGADGLVEVYW